MAENIPTPIVRMENATMATVINMRTPLMTKYVLSFPSDSISCCLLPLKWAVSAVLLGWVNRLGGAVFGFILGAFFCGALLTIWAKYLGIAGPIGDSAFAKLLLDVFPIALALLPSEFDSVRSFFQR